MMDPIERREFLGMAGAATAVPFVSLPSSGASRLSPYGRANFGLRGFDPEEQTIQYSGDRVGIHVEYDEDSADALESWIDDSDDRELLAHNEPVNVMSIIAPTSDVGGQLIGSAPIDDLGFIADDVDLVMDISLPEPVEPVEREEVDLTANLSAFDRWVTSTTYIDDGLAYDDDMPAKWIDEVREYTAATADDFGGTYPDTSGVTIAVLDTGVNAGAEFEDDGGESRILDASKNYVLDSEPTVADQGLDAVDDGHGHGTWVAAAAAGRDPDDEGRHGYATNADILALKVLDDDGSGNTAAIARGITYAADEGADIACLSLGSPAYSVAIDRAMAYARGQGMLCVVAVGNDRYATRWNNHPSNIPDAIGVTATSAEEPEFANVAYFANHGPHPGTTDFSSGATTDSQPAIAAPGAKITVQTPDGEDESTGTSMAAPCVAGGLAIVAAEANIDDPDDLESRLVEYSRPFPAAGETEAEHGWLDVAAMVDEEQADVDDDAEDFAAERDVIHEGLADSQGGFLARLL